MTSIEYVIVKNMPMPKIKSARNGRMVDLVSKLGECEIGDCVIVADGVLAANAQAFMMAYRDKNFSRRALEHGGYGLWRTK